MFEFDEATHTYRLNGSVLPSVTQIINAILPVYQASDWHLQRGTATHHACFLLDCGVLDWSSVDPEIEPRVKAWEKFRRDFGGKIMANEQRLASKKMRFAGTLDRLVLKGNDLIVADLKNSVSPQVKLQLALYSILWKENTGQAITKAVAVELREDGSYVCHWQDKRELRQAEQTAISLLSVFGFAKSNGLVREK